MLQKCTHFDVLCCSIKVLKNLISELSESVEKFTKSWKIKNFFTCDFSFLTLEPSILAFTKKPLLLPKSWTGKFKAEKFQFLYKWCINLKVLYYTNFSRATFFVFCEPLNSQQGLANPPPQNKWAFRTYVQCCV